MRIALTCAIGAAFALIAVAANAQEAGRYDRKIELAAAERAAARLGQLRGSIAPEAKQEAFFAERQPTPLGFGLPTAPRPEIETPPISMKGQDRLAVTGTVPHRDSR